MLSNGEDARLAHVWPSQINKFASHLFSHNRILKPLTKTNLVVDCASCDVRNDFVGSWSGHRKAHAVEQRMLLTKNLARSMHTS